MAHTKGLLAPTGTKARALALLAAAPGGLTSRDIAEALSAVEQRVSNAMSELSRAGVIIGIIEPIGQANARRRWCLPEHAEAIRAAKSKAPVKAAHWQKSGLGKTPYRERRAGNMDSAQKTVLQGYEDKRFVVEKPEHPCFSAMKPGKYLETGSAIERAYAARDKE